MKHIKQILFSLITLSTSLNAIIPEMEIWADEKNEHFRYFLKDIHVDYKGAKNTIQQQQDILWALQQNKDSFAIVEDSISLFTQYRIDYQLQTKGSTTITFPNSLEDHINNRSWHNEGLTEAQKQEQQLYWASPLEFLAHVCQNTDVSTHNVECETLIGVYETQKFNNEKEHQEAQQIVYDTLYAYTNNLKSDPLLTPYCNLLDQKFEHLQGAVGLSKNIFLSMASCVRYILLEARVLYQLNAWKEIKHGYIVTGADHINRIKQNLPVLGYKHIKTIGIPTAVYTTEVIDQEKNIIANKVAYIIPDDVAASNPLDLHKTFTEIFNEQKS